MVFVMFSLFKSFYCCDPRRKAHMKASSTHLSPLTHLPAALAHILTGTGQGFVGIREGRREKVLAVAKAYHGPSGSLLIS